tara:strand:- start:682 stop:1026 length:345 start_codon:yes stop_codon:yes gene_type:complete
MNEVVIYESSEKQIQVEVEFDGETAWLTQNQLRNLFNQTKQNISLHINNCFKEGELDKNSVVKESLTTANDGKKYKTKHYNLDMIILVGYRIKSNMQNMHIANSDKLFDQGVVQ